MSLTQALNISASGLRAAQAGLALVSSNVANADTPGYVRKTLVQSVDGAGGYGAPVRVTGIDRELDAYVQRQLRVEMAGGAYADLRAQFYDRLQLLYGAPGSDTAVETVFNNFTSALQALATSPDSATTRAAAVSAAQVLAQRLNGMTADIQALRGDAEAGLADATANANAAMQGIARINRQLAGVSSNDAATASLLDERDRYIDQLAQLMDIRVVPGDANQVTVFTGSGVQLVGVDAARLEFQPQDTMTAAAQWSADPAERSVGTVTLVAASGQRTDLLANNNIRSGTIAAYAEMRDRVLPGAQAQLDSFAAAMARALSDTTEAGTPASAGAQNGFDLDLSGLLAGNSMRFGYTDVASGTQKSVTFVRVDDPAALPLDPGADPDNRIVGLDFSGGPASVAAQVAAALGTDFTVSNPAGTTLRVLDDGGTAVTLDSATATKTATGFASGAPQMPLFVDRAAPITGAITAAGAQTTGLAGRIAVNAAVVADPSKLVLYASGTPAGDATRPDFLYDQLTQASLAIGNGSAATQATLPGFLRQAIVQQGQDAAAAANLREGQQVVVDALRQRLTESSGVSIDEEMTTLLALQSAYSANARVLSAVRDMLDTLANL
jgi:flagellar hook-associated protein 1 FlgK